MVDLDDKIYIQDVLDGKTSSFTHLVNKYKDRVFTVCYRIVRHREDAEDIAQATFIKAFNSLYDFQGKSKFSTWLYTIAYRTAISKVQLKKVEMVHEDFLLETSSGDILQQIEGLKDQEQQFYVKKAIEKLNEMEGLIISLFYFDESSVQEIVEITGLSESNVKVKLHRARKHLKVNLEGLLNKEMKSIL